MKKSFLLSLIGLSVAGIIVFACNKKSEYSIQQTNNSPNLLASRTNGFEIISNSATEFKCNYILEDTLLEYKSEVISSGVTQSTLEVFKSGQNTKFIYLLDINEVGYKFNENKKVIAIAEALVDEMSEGESDILVARLETFGNLLKESEVDFNSYLINSFGFHFAIATTIKRSFSNATNECGCNTYPLFLKDASPFLCQEDLMVDRVALKNRLDSITPLNHQDSIAKSYITGLSGTQLIPVLSIMNSFQSNVIYLNFLEESYGYYQNNPLGDTPPCLQGSAVGCCGNYSGCCLYSNIWCLVHDVLCLQCNHWYCGYWCVPYGSGN